MTSTFTWLDHREEDAQRVREALAAFDEQGMVDPLGFGVVRDAFSEMLFPGMSTVQTRARYFLFVPWVYSRLQRERVTPQDASGRAREFEVELIEALLRGSHSHEGIIGRYSRQTTKQLPSFIYWGGLGRWGIRLFNGTRGEYFSALDQLARGNGQPDAGSSPNPWHPNLPAEPPNLYDETTLRLALEEGEFLRDRVLTSAPDSYLAVLVRDGTSDMAADTPWEHPLAPTLPPHLGVQLKHAHLFAVSTRGAGLLYNAELSRRLEADGGEPLSRDYEEALDEWLREVADLKSAFSDWDRQEFWNTVATQNPAVPTSVRTFVDSWLDVVQENPTAVRHDDRFRERLRHREAALKGPRAKLANRRARERSPSAQGDGLMTFRWPQVSDIVGDILEGVEGHAQPA